MELNAKKRLRETTVKLKTFLQQKVAASPSLESIDYENESWVWAISLAVETAGRLRGIEEQAPLFLGLNKPEKRLLYPGAAESCQEFLQDCINDADITEAFRADDALGWLHQYWNDGERELITVASGENVKIEADKVIPRTQVYTDRYMIEYLLQNTLGKLWFQMKPYSELVTGWEYLVRRSEDETEFSLTAAKDIRLIDPACGAGNILLAAFEMLFAMYGEENPKLSSADICTAIFKNNLFGIDIDAKAILVARTALWLKALEKAPHIGVDSFQHLCDNIIAVNACNAGNDAGELGSLIAAADLDPNNALAVLLNRRYHVVVTNPPYIDKRDYGETVRCYLKRHYPSGAGNLYTGFILRCLELSAAYVGMVTPQTFLYLSSYAALRNEIFAQAWITTLAHLGLGSFEDAVVDPVLFVLAKNATADCKNFCGLYFRLLDTQLKQQSLLAAVKAYNGGSLPDNVFQLPLRQVARLEGAPVAYWLGGRIFDLMVNCAKLRDYADVALGMKTSNNSRWVRFWWEVDWQAKDWAPYEKEASGYRYRRNSAHLVRWSRKAVDFYKSHYSAQLPNPKYWFKAGIVFGLVSSKAFSAKLLPDGHMSDMAASYIFPHEEDDTYFFLALLNSRFYQWLLKMYNPSVNFQPIDLQRLPLPDSLLRERLKLSRLAMLAAQAALSLRELEITDRGYVFKPAVLLPLQGQMQEVVDHIWLECLKLLLAKDEIDANIVNLLALSPAERCGMSQDIGETASDYSLINGYDLLPATIEGSLLAKRRCREMSDAALAELKTRLNKLYTGTLSGSALAFPERFLEAAALELQIHPVSVYNLLKQGICREGWQCQPLEKKITEDLFSAIVLSLLGHSWPQGDNGFPAGYDDNCFISAGNCGGQPLYQQVREFISRYCEVETAEKTFIRIVGQSLADWLEFGFFKRHIIQFRRRPVIWQLTVGKRGKTRVSVLLHHKNMCKLQNMGDCLASRLESRMPDDVARAEIEEFLRLIDRLGDYRYEQDFGVRVNIAPLQNAGLLAARVLSKSEEMKALADYQAWPQSFF